MLGRMWVMDNNLVKKIQELYAVEVLEQKEFNTAYNNQKYMFTLLEK